MSDESTYTHSYNKTKVSPEEILAHLNKLKFTVTLKPDGVNALLAVCHCGIHHSDNVQITPGMSEDEARHWLQLQPGVLSAETLEHDASSLRMHVCYDPDIAGALVVPSASC